MAETHAGESRNRTVSPMSLKYAILGLLEQQPHYGYEIKQKFEQMMGELWPVSYGQLYPTLRKLAEQELVTMKTVQGKKAVEKNVYSITKEGSEYFRQWLLQRRKKDQLSIKDEFTLSLFFIDQVDKNTAREIFTSKMLEIQERLKSYADDYSTYGTKTALYKKALTRKMILHMEAEEQWLNDVLQQL